MKKPKPEPVVVRTVCSLCDQPWENHGDEPTTEDCIRLLKAELAKRPVQTWTINSAPNWQVSDTARPLPWPGRSITVANTSNTAGAVIEFRRPEEPPDEPMAAVS